MGSSPILYHRVIEILIREITKRWSSRVESICIALTLLGVQAIAQDIRGLEGMSHKQIADYVDKFGDAGRGAVVFHSASFGCGKCHTVYDSSSSIGPNLSVWENRPSTSDLIESVLVPSQKIHDKFKTTLLRTDDGTVHNGILISETNDAITLRVGPETNDIKSIPKLTIDDRREGTVSIMPVGILQANANREQFLDLIAYLNEIAKGGPTRAKELQPSTAQLRLQIPEYESHLDHKALIRDWNDKSLQRGEAIYHRVCANCHGTLEQPGSLPTALRFGEGKFKHGADPLSIYQTLTYGRGLMLPQVWMVPQQKYDVIHYVREHFLKSNNSTPWVDVDAAYLDSLPPGDTRGPEPTTIEPWRTMDYGSMMMTTIEVGNKQDNIAYKGIAVRVDHGVGGISQGHNWMLFDHDTLRWAGAWSGSDFIDWQSIQFDGKHGIHPRHRGDLLFSNPNGPGWAEPGTESFADNQRVIGRDNKRYGPLPRTWGQFKGVSRYGQEVLISYDIGGVRISEKPFLLSTPSSRTQSVAPSNPASNKDSSEIFGRVVRIAPRSKPLLMVVATLPKNSNGAWECDAHGVSARWNGEGADHVAYIAGKTEIPQNHSDAKPNSTNDSVARNLSTAKFIVKQDRLCVQIPAGDEALSLAIALTKVNKDAGVAEPAISEIQRQLDEQCDDRFERFNVGGAAEWPQWIEATTKVYHRDSAWSVEELVQPLTNPWLARTRVTGIAFSEDPNNSSLERMYVCTWDGDVWLVTGTESLNDAEPKLRWKRVAAGLFQPLGIIAAKDGLMLTCRDQLVRLRDLNGDEEMDQYECFNNDHQVTEHFHEFAMGLQRDGEGNWYYAKSARHALPALVPHHGTLLKVTADGTSTEIVANGFRAANGVCLNDDGSFIVTDQEGHWNPKNRINWVEPGKFYGNMFGYHNVTDKSDAAMQQPLCWITNAFDRSPAELLWAKSDRWGPLNGKLLNLSYGYGRVYVVPFEQVDGQKQGGMSPLPIPDLPTGIIRGRFSQRDGQLYVGGMFAWASSQQEQEGGLFRIRYVGGRVDMPVSIHAFKNADGVPSVDIEFTEVLDEQAMRDTARTIVRVWDLKRSANYGSDHLNERTLKCSSSELLDDNKTLRIEIPELEPTWGMSIDIQLKTSDGTELKRTIHNTIHGFSAAR